MQKTNSNTKMFKKFIHVSEKKNKHKLLDPEFFKHVFENLEVLN